MRVQYIRIDKWRHFESVELVVPHESSVVSLVGGNGTGKSQILELIAACAERIGISQGFHSPRGNPFHEPSEFEVRFYIAKGAVDPDPRTTGDNSPEYVQANHSDWDGTITILKSDVVNRMTAGGISQEHSESFAGWVRDRITNSSSTHYLILDADRSYPQIQVPTNELGSAFETDWDGQRKARSSATTKSLYEEWFRYLLGTEGRESAKHIAEIRRAREARQPEPTFVDRLADYKNAVQKVSRRS